MCTNYYDVVFGWYKRGPWHMKKWSFFQMQKAVMEPEEVILSLEFKGYTY
jgi:hypothetical protein